VFAVVPIVLVAALMLTYLAYGIQLTRRSVRRNDELLRAALGTRVTMTVTVGKQVQNLTGVVERVGPHEFNLTEDGGQRQSLPLSSVSSMRPM